MEDVKYNKSGLFNRPPPTSVSTSAKKQNEPISIPIGNGCPSINANPGDGPMIAKIQEMIENKKHVVCKIMTYDGYFKPNGTAFMIGPNLLITNHHVLPNQEIAKKSHALFEVFSDSSSADKSNRLYDYVSLFPNQKEGGYFFSGVPDDLSTTVNYSKEYLDYSIVAFKPSDHTTKIAKYAFSLFENEATECISPQKEMPIGMIHFPETPSENTISGLLKISLQGRILKLPEDTIYGLHNIQTEKGSSGAPLIVSTGQATGIHCKGKIANDRTISYADPHFNGFIPIVDIMRHLSFDVKNQIKNYIENYKKPSHNNNNYYPPEFPAYLPSQAEAGSYIDTAINFQELIFLFNQIYARKNELRQIAIIGAPGMGKNFLATRLALQMRLHFSIVLFLPENNCEKAKKILLTHAKDRLKTRNDGESDESLIQRYLKNESKPYLLVLDEAEGDKTYKKLQPLLPDSHQNKFILTTSHIAPGSIQERDCYLIKPFNLDESIQFLKILLPSLNVEDIKLKKESSEFKQLKHLLETLEGIPSAIKCTAELIKLTGGSLQTFFSDFQKEGIAFFKKSLSNSHLSTIQRWEKLVAILKDHSLSTTAEINTHRLALDILFLCAFFKSGPIYDALIVQCFAEKYTQPQINTSDYRVAIRLLLEHSVVSRVNNPSICQMSCFSLPLFIRDIIEYLIPPKEKINYLIAGTKALARFYDNPHITGIEIEVCSRQFKQIIDRTDWDEAFPHISSIINTHKQIRKLILSPLNASPPVIDQHSDKPKLSFNLKLRHWKNYLSPIGSFKS
ncbi:MAG: NB-ARC domain-containing protein [Candidatus Rhabdochlamydia sp.]